MEDPNKLKKSKDDDEGEASSSQPLIAPKEKQIALVKQGDKERPVLIGASIKKKPVEPAKGERDRRKFREWDSFKEKNNAGAIKVYELGDEYKSDILYPEKYLEADWNPDLNAGFIIGAVESGREVKLVTNYEYYVNMGAGVLNNAGFWELLCLKRCGYEFYKDTDGKIFAVRRKELINNYRDIIEHTFNEYNTIRARIGELDNIYKGQYATETRELISSLSSAQVRQNTERNQAGTSAASPIILALQNLKKFKPLLEEISQLGLGKNLGAMSEDEQIQLAMTLSLREGEQGFNLQDNRFTRDLGLGCQNVLGDGFCLFRAIAQQIVGRNLNDQRHPPLIPLPTTMEEVLERIAIYFSEHSEDLMDRVFPPPRLEEFGTDDRSEELFLIAQEAYNGMGMRQQRLEAFRANFYEYINLGNYNAGGELVNGADWLPQVMSEIFHIDIDIYDAQQPTGFHTDNGYEQRIGLGRVNNDHYISLNGNLEVAWEREQQARLSQSGNPSSITSSSTNELESSQIEPRLSEDEKRQIELAKVATSKPDVIQPPLPSLSVSTGSSSLTDAQSSQKVWGKNLSLKVKEPPVKSVHTIPRGAVTGMVAGEESDTARKQQQLAKQQETKTKEEQKKRGMDKNGSSSKNPRKDDDDSGDRSKAARGRGNPRGGRGG